MKKLLTLLAFLPALFGATGDTGAFTPVVVAPIPDKTVAVGATCVQELQRTESGAGYIRNNEFYGDTSHGESWSTSATPTGCTFNTSTGAWGGTHTATFSGNITITATKTQCVTAPSCSVQDTYAVTVAAGGTLPIGTLTRDGPATPEQIALVLPVTGSLPTTAYATMRYRVTGSGTWVTGHPLHRVRPDLAAVPPSGPLADAFAWPIIGINSGTSYDVEVTVTSGASSVIRTLTASTRSPPAASGTTTISLAQGSTAAQIATAINNAAAGAVIQLANGTTSVSAQISISNSNATAANPIYFRGANGTILHHNSLGTLFRFTGDSDNIVFEGLTITGLGVDGGFTPDSVAFDTVATVTNITIRNITATGWDMFFNGQGGAINGGLIYDNTIVGNNLWTQQFLEDGAWGQNHDITWSDDGILIQGEGNAVFQNTISGFGDTFSVAKNDAVAVSSNNHIYRNDVLFSCDDTFESDYGKRNITFYDNRVRNAMSLVSADPIFGGPLLVARNIALNLGRTQFKLNNDNSGHYLYNNTVVRVLGYPVSSGLYGWAQSFNGAQRAWAYRNNILIWRGGVNETFKFDVPPASSQPLDFTHNAWWPDGDDFTWGSAGSATLAGMKTIMAAAPTAALIGNSYSTPTPGTNTARMANDIISEADPFTTDITLGANYLTQVTTAYTPTLQTGSALLNAGKAIPGVTDGFTGAAPDMGAIVTGRSIPAWGDQSAIPSYISSLSSFQVRALSGVYAPTNGKTAIRDATPAQWLTGDPVNDNIVTTWSGGFKSLVGTKMYLMGGGHTVSDGANNGIYVYDYAGTTKPTGWSILPGSQSDPSAIVASAIYSDGRPSSIHSYDSLVHAHSTNTLYKFMGARYGDGVNAKTQIFKINLASVAANPWERLPDLPGDHNAVAWNNNYNGTLYDPVTGKIMVTNLNAFQAYFYRTSNDTWSAAKPMSQDTGGSTMAWDPIRGRGLRIGSPAFSPSVWTVDFVAESFTSAFQAIAGVPTSQERSVLFDPDRTNSSGSLGVFWVFGGRTPPTVLYEINAQTLALTATHTLTGDAIAQEGAGTGGSYGRFVFLRTWRAIGFVDSRFSPAYVIKLP